MAFLQHLILKDRGVLVGQGRHWVSAPWGQCQGTHHAGVHRGLLDVPGNACHKGVPVFKVRVKISLWGKRRDGD